MVVLKCDVDQGENAAECPESGLTPWSLRGIIATR